MKKEGFWFTVSVTSIVLLFLYLISRVLAGTNF